MNRRFYLFAFFFLLVSCSGYRFRAPSNPLAQYNISSISVPMFQNRSSLPDVSAIFTQEIVRELSKFPGLKVYPGDIRKTDAVLVGIIYSKQYIREVLKTTREHHVTGENLGKDSLGNRRDFRVPADTLVSLSVNLILIKSPTAKELDFLSSSSAEKIIYKNPKIIFNNTYAVSSSYQREIYPEVVGDYNEGGRSMNYTKNRGMLHLKEKEMAISLATAFREMGLYVF